MARIFVCVFLATCHLLTCVAENPASSVPEMKPSHCIGNRPGSGAGEENGEEPIQLPFLMSDKSRKGETKTDIHIATALCGMKRFDEAITMLKSTIMFSQVDAKLVIHIFGDNETVPAIENWLRNFQPEVRKIGWDFDFHVRPIWFPDGPESGGGEAGATKVKNSWKWISDWVPCQSQRLFFPSLLSDVDSVIYLDIDTIVLSDFRIMWNYFDEMRSTSQMIAMSKHSELPGSGFYFRKSKVPYYGATGVDSGVMLMNLTRLREFGFEDKMHSLRKEYGRLLELPDQDLLNILFHFEPNGLLVLPCNTNFNQGHCDQTDPGAYCEAAEQNGVVILHGTGRSFFKDQMPFFKPIYQAFAKHNPAETSFSALLTKLQDAFNQFGTPCFRLDATAFYQHLQKYSVQYATGECPVQKFDQQHLALK